MKLSHDEVFTFIIIIILIDRKCTEKPECNNKIFFIDDIST